MKYCVTTDSTGRITACSSWSFSGASLRQCEAVGYPDGRLYRSDVPPQAYAIPGSAEQYVGECPVGGVMTSGPRPEDVRDMFGVVAET